MGQSVSSRYCAGFGITEALVAMAVLGVAASLIASVFKNVDAQTRKSRVISTMVAIESSILAAMEDKENFKNLLPELDAASKGAPVPPLSLKSFGTLFAKYPSKGAPLFFTSEGTACTGSKCEISVELDLKGSGGVIKGAYKIALTPELTKIVVAAPLGGNFKDPDDYTLILPKKYFANPESSESCKNGGILRRMNKLTGESECWDVPADEDKCLPGEIMRGFRADADSGRLKPVCVRLRQVACKTKAGASQYLVLQSFNPYYFDPDVGSPGANEGACVPLMAREVPATPDGFSCPMGHSVYFMTAQRGPCRLNPKIPEKWEVEYKTP